MVDARESRPTAIAEAEVAAHTILLPRGTFCIYVVEVSPGIPAAQLPGLGVAAAPGEEGAAVEVARLSGEPWLRRHGDAVLVRVHAPEVRLLLTSYNLLRARGAKPPKIEVQRLDDPNAKPVASPERDRAATAEVVRPSPTPPAEIIVPEIIVPEIIVHVRKRGDLRGRLGEWLGQRGGELWVEGVTIPPLTGFEPDALEYQAVFGQDWLSPWVAAGQYCGSRGMQLPILGLRLRLSDDAARRFAVEVSAVFSDATSLGPVQPGEICAVTPLQPLTALRVEVSSKQELGRAAAMGKPALNGEAGAPEIAASAKPKGRLRGRTTQAP